MLQEIGLDLYGLGSTPLTQSWALQRNYNWQAVFPTTINSIPGLWISQYCQEVHFGDYNVTATPIKYGPEVRRYVKDLEISNATFIFLAPSDQTVLNYFLGWRKQISSDGYFFPKSFYSHDVYVLLYEGLIEVQRFRLMGCFPLEIPKQDLSYSGEDVVRYTVTLNVDKIEVGSAISSIVNVLHAGRQITKTGKQITNILRR